MINFVAIFNDKRTWKAIDLLLDKGFCEENTIPFLRHICMLPEYWGSLDAETPMARIVRRNNLAIKINKLADEIKADSDAKHFRLLNGNGNVITSRIPNKITIHDLLYGFSDLIRERNSAVDMYNQFIPETKSTKHSISNFVRQDIAKHLRNLLPEEASRPIASVTYLSNVVLSNYNQEEVTTEQTRETYRNLERQL